MTAPADSGAPGTDTQDANDEGGFTPPATQAELDRIISERVNRTKNQFKDYAQYKAAAEELASIKAASQTEAERLAQETSRWQSEAETWRKAAVGNRIEALASTEFADASDAVTALSGNDYLDAGGQIDEARIRADLADVLERKPHWRRPADSGPPAPRAPAPNAAQGSGGGRAAADPAAELASIMQGQLNRP